MGYSAKVYTGRLSPDRGPTINTPFLRYIPYLSLKNGIPFHIRNNLTFHFLININKSVAPGKGIRGIQPRFPPQIHWKHVLGYPEYFFRPLEMHSKRRNKICICSVIQGELESFRNSRASGFSFTGNFRCNLVHYDKKKKIVDSSLHHIFEYENFRFRFPYDKWPNLGCDMWKINFRKSQGIY